MTIHNDIALLHPKFGRKCKRLAEYLIDAYETGRTKTRFEVFETFRDPMRQNDLLRKGVSKAMAWQSAHQFGLAVDFVPYITPLEAAALAEDRGEKVLPGWNWAATHDYDFLAASAKLHNVLTPIKWDPCHVQAPEFEEIRKVYRIHLE